VTTPLPPDDAPVREKSGTPHGLALTCPHCGKRAYIRTSRSITETYREAWAICTGCGFTGKAHAAWDVEVSPSLLPNPRVTLPRLDRQEAIDAFVAAELSTRDQLDMFANTG